MFQELILSIKQGNHKRATTQELVAGELMAGGGEDRPGTHGPKEHLRLLVKARRDLKVIQVKDPEDTQEAQGHPQDLLARVIPHPARQAAKVMFLREVRRAEKGCVLIADSPDISPQIVPSPKRAKELLVKESFLDIAILVDNGDIPVSGARIPGLRVSKELRRPKPQKLNRRRQRVSMGNANIPGSKGILGLSV